MPHESVAPISPAQRFVIPSDFAVSVAFTRTACHVMGIPTACLFDEMEDCSIHIRVCSFLGTCEAIVIALHENVEAQSFL
jgi:hypothetical protein